MALTEQCLGLFRIQGASFFALFLPLDRLSLTARKAPVIGAAIFEFDFALLDASFLDFKLSQDRLDAEQCQRRRR